LDEDSVNPAAVIDLGRQALELTLLVAGPLLLATLAAGLIVGVFQAATQINEMTLSFVPKLVALFLALALAGSWMLGLLTDFTRRLYEAIPAMIG
jgi:flagellar biosynthetic protein FliQ